MKKVIVFAMMLMCSSAFAEFSLMPDLTATQFKDLVSDLSMAVTPTISSPAEPLKTLGFDIALESQLTTINSDADRWENAWGGAEPANTVWANRVHVQKGLPFGVDLGASVTQGANLDFTAVTLEGKYAFLKGSVATPALSARVAYTKVFNIEDVNLQTFLAGLYISKGFLILTPYAGIEDVYAIASEDSDADLDDETANNIRGLVGLQICPFPLFVINVEAAKAADVYQFGLKAGIRF